MWKISDNKLLSMLSTFSTIPTTTTTILYIYIIIYMYIGHYEF